MDYSKAQIEKNITKCEPLKRVFLTFADEVFKKRWGSNSPDYDLLDHVINRAILEMDPPPQPVLFTWLESDMSSRNAAISDLLKSPIQKAKDIPSRSIGNFIIYPPVNFNYFHDRRTGLSRTLSGRILSSFLNVMSACDTSNF